MYEIREMLLSDYDLALELWSCTEGMGLSEADSKEAVAFYLARNPEMSFVCAVQDQIIGTILCGHDGRRGYIYHVAVSKEYRGHSIGKKLVESSLKRLKEQGIMKCHIMVIADNEIGNSFWQYMEWSKRAGINLYSHHT